MKKSTVRTLVTLVAGICAGAALTSWVDVTAVAQTSRAKRFAEEQHDRVLLIRDTKTGVCYLALNEGGITRAECG